MIFDSRLNNIQSAFFVYNHRTGSDLKIGPILGDPIAYDFHGSYGDPTLLFSQSDASPKIMNGQVFVNKLSVNPRGLKKNVKYSILSLITTGNVMANLYYQRQKF
jgi:hypothetical protein